MSEYLIGFDLGGTKIECAVLKQTDFSVVSRDRIPTQSELGYDSIIKNICQLYEKVTSQVGIDPKKVGLAMPGTIDIDTKLMKNCNATCLNGKDLQADLTAAMKTEVHLSNDANCFALAETHLGIVKDVVPNSKVNFGIIMGTGVGGCVVVDGKALTGIHAIAGEWGHNFLDESGGYCFCGRKGCVETVLSGPSLENYYYHLTQNRLKLDEINQRYQNKSDVNAEKTIERLLYFFGQAVSVVINIVDPDSLILGGGVGNIDALYTQSQKYIEPFLFSKHLKTKILKPKLGDSAGVFGAAFLAL